MLAALGVDALGVNCSAGPADLQPVVREMLEVASCPVILQANAGLPEVVDGQTTYTLPPDEYAAAVLPMIEAGATVIGGCCGTDPDYICRVAKLIESRSPEREAPERERVLDRAREAADEGGRDAEILEIILGESDRTALKQAFICEFDD